MVQHFHLFVWCLVALLAQGCYAPLQSPGVPASTLPDGFRLPFRTTAPYSNLAMLNALPSPVYPLGPGDVLQVTVPALFAGAETRPLTAQVLEDGTLSLPLLDPVPVGGLSVGQAQRAVSSAYGRNVLVNPKVTLVLAQKATIEVAVMGQVTKPGKFSLPRGQNSVGFALAAAEGLSAEAADSIEVHRRTNAMVDQFGQPIPQPDAAASNGNVVAAGPTGGGHVLTIRLRESPFAVARPISTASHCQSPWTLSSEDVSLKQGDVVFVPRKTSEVFYVVGPLDRTRVVNFRLQDRDRELGNGFLLPPDREIDVLTAVTMAGYIDPINSPTTVTLQRIMPDGSSLLVHVDLIAARFDRRETVLVQPGDIIYLNPDADWWMRRTFDRIVADLLTIPYRAAMFRWIDVPNN